MAHRVQIKAGFQQVTLPDGQTYNEGDIAVLSDDEYGRVTAATRTAVLDYLGEESDPELEASFQDMLDDATIDGGAP